MSTSHDHQDQQPGDVSSGYVTYEEYTFIDVRFAMLSDSLNQHAWIQSDTVVPIEE